MQPPRLKPYHRHIPIGEGLKGFYFNIENITTIIVHLNIFK